MKRTFPFLLLTAIFALAASCGEDRSGEQPFAPTVLTTGISVVDHTANFSGQVTASPNSKLRECGFTYGNDTLRRKIPAIQVTEEFSAEVDSMKPGHYFVAAYAANGVGPSYGDTLYFTIE